LLTQEKLKQILHYDLETGVWTWIIKTNKQRKSKIAGTFYGRYQRISIDKKLYQAHRLAFLYVYGSMPVLEIDHIDGDGFNNKFSNLREVTHSVNLQNRKKADRDNKTGFLGVSYNNGMKAFSAVIYSKGKRIHLGYKQSAVEAHALYLEAKKIYHA
jgi:hypothetical protein